MMDRNAIRRCLWSLAFDKPVAFNNPGDEKWRLSSSGTRIIADAILALQAETPAGDWRTMDSVPGDDTKLLAACDDGRVMIWTGKVLAMAMKPDTPDHLRFPAARWMPLPVYFATHGDEPTT
jgi:hypothetical protein